MTTHILHTALTQFQLISSHINIKIINTDVILTLRPDPPVLYRLIRSLTLIAASRPAIFVCFTLIYIQSYLLHFCMPP